VGAAIKFTHSDTITGGCNVENGSYGATICAERGAIMKAIAEEGAGKLEYVVVVTDTEEPVSPCGMCQQVIGEFATNRNPDPYDHPRGKRNWRSLFRPPAPPVPPEDHQH
jgi:cytidine deaminase